MKEFLPFGHFWTSNYGGTGGSTSYSAEAQLIFAAFTTPPSDPRKALIDACVVSLKSAGVWAKLDCMYMLAAADSQAATINWKSPTNFTLTEINVPVFTADRGYNPVAGVRYLDSNWIPGTNGVNYQRDSASVHIWNTTATRADSQAMIGLTDAGSNVIVNPWNLGADNAQVALNCAAVNTLNVGGPAINLFSLSRTLSASYIVSRDGVSLGTQSTASVALGTVMSMKILYNGSLATNRQAALGAWGGGLSSTEITALWNAVRAYMTGVGVP